MNANRLVKLKVNDENKFWKQYYNIKIRISITNNTD